MMKKLLFILPMIACMASPAAHANWEYHGDGVRDGYFRDDGRRFIIAIRGGVAYGIGKTKSDIGALSAEYYFNETDGSVVIDDYYKSCVKDGRCDPSDYVFAGAADVGKLPISKNYSSTSFIGGMAIGWTLPVTPHWRFQVDWDYISESEYNISPMLKGEVPLTDGDVEGLRLSVRSGAVQSTVTTNVFSTMAIRDFYDGWQKPLRKFIPYAGFGLGYADSDTELNFSDLYGDLSSSNSLQNFGTRDDYGILQFYTAKKSSSNLAAILTAGFSYGVSKSFFLDAGFRFIYIPRIKWALSNKDGSHKRDWFHSDNMLFSNFLFGFRWEF